jgi:F-type H+-transporting ATPase subunit a
MNIFTALEHDLHVPGVVLSALFASGLLLLAGMSIRSAIKNGGGVLPDEGVTLRNVFEVIIEQLLEMGDMAMGGRENARRYFPIVGTIFFFVLISNLMGLVPGLAGSTSDINTTFAWAIISFVVYNYVGIKQHGWKYIYQFMGPSMFELELGGKHYHVRLLAPFFIILEVPLHLFRIGTLAIRLLANMFADHAVVLAWLALVPIAIPAIFMGLGTLVAFLQAFVFALLTMIYIGMALEEAH